MNEIPSTENATDQAVPHPVLDKYYDGADAREQKVQQMFDDSAGHYDWITNVMSFGSGRWYRKQALMRAGLAEGMRQVDVGAGTGVVSLVGQDIVGEQGEVVAVDPSPGMLAVAKESGVKQTLEGKGEDLPVESNYFDLLSMGYALRHVADLDAAFAEYFRVLKPGGKVCLLEITRPENRMRYWMVKVYLKYLVPGITRIFRRSRKAQELMSYYWDTINTCVPPKAIMEALAGAGFEKVDRYVEFGIFSEYRAVKPAQPEAVESEPVA